MATRPSLSNAAVCKGCVKFISTSPRWRSPSIRLVMAAQTLQIRSQSRFSACQSGSEYSDLSDSVLKSHPRYCLRAMTTFCLARTAAQRSYEIVHTAMMRRTAGRAPDHLVDPGPRTSARTSSASVRRRFSPCPPQSVDGEVIRLLFEGLFPPRTPGRIKHETTPVQLAVSEFVEQYECRKRS